MVFSLSRILFNVIFFSVLYITYLFCHIYLFLLPSGKVYQFWLLGLLVNFKLEQTIFNFQEVFHSSFFCYHSLFLFYNNSIFLNFSIICEFSKVHLSSMNYLLVLGLINLDLNVFFLSAIYFPHVADKILVVHSQS